MRHRLLAVLVLLFAAVAAQATVITYIGPSGETSHGYPIGPYSALVDGQAQSLICDDFLHHITTGESWQALTLSFTDLSPVEQTIYRPALWLADKMFTEPIPRADEQWALWHLLDPWAPLYGSAGSELAWALSQPGLPTTHYVIYRPVDRTCQGPQEMIGIASPEPVTFLLVGIGLMAIGAIRKQRR